MWSIDGRLVDATVSLAVQLLSDRGLQHCVDVVAGSSIYGTINHGIKAAKGTWMSVTQHHSSISILSAPIHSGPGTLMQSNLHAMSRLRLQHQPVGPSPLLPCAAACRLLWPHRKFLPKRGDERFPEDQDRNAMRYCDWRTRLLMPPYRLSVAYGYRQVPAMHAILLINRFFWLL